jgi:hypothetical protein
LWLIVIMFSLREVLKIHFSNDRDSVRECACLENTCEYPRNHKFCAIILEHLFEFLRFHILIL